jgi:sugar/nucleoside kinase (ribokinase family)
LSALVVRARAAGATVSLDPGWDPEERWSSVAAAAAAVDVLLPNAQEAERLAGAAGDEAVRPEGVGGEGEVGEDAVWSAGAAGSEAPAVEAAGAALAAAGPLVAVKLGAGGAVVFAGGEVVRAAAPRVAVLDATGAGDAFDAGFIAGWLDGAGPAGALALGCACGALSTRALGGTAAQRSARRPRRWRIGWWCERPRAQGGSLRADPRAAGRGRQRRRRRPGARARRERGDGPA